MKNYFLFLAALILASCANEPKDYVTLSGKITNQNSDSLQVRSRTYKKTIKVNADGTFKDTLKVEAGVYSLYDGNEATSAFLKNGFDLQVTLDTEQFDETVTYSGIGAEHSNFLAAKALKEEKLLDIDHLASLDSLSLATELEGIKKELLAFYNADASIDTSVVNNSVNTLDRMIGSYKRYLDSQIALKKALPKGADSPVFDNYENFNGENTSLSDLKGKYVYVDVWATWCGPCKAEIPYLKEVEKKYHDKNIAFVSISVDDEKRSGSKEQAHADWKKMVADKELGGIQLFAPNGWQSQFVQDYKIQGIPRFILIDPQGKIVTPTAPRPSSQELIKLFDQENI